MIEHLTHNWFLTLIIFPILINFFKKEIVYLLTVYNIYRLRAFDIDGNPSTEDIVQILCIATGKWKDAIIEKYVFSFSAKTRGVYLRYPDEGREKISFLVWATLRKRTPPPK
jgi:hypothetical protein